MALPNLVSPISIIPSSIYITGIVAAVNDTFSSGVMFTVPANTVYVTKRVEISYSATNPRNSRYFYMSLESGVPNIFGVVAFYTANTIDGGSLIESSVQRIYLENQSLYWKYSSVTPLTFSAQVDVYK